MGTAQFCRVVATRKEAHWAMLDGYERAKGLILDGHQVEVIVRELQEDLSARQRRFFHGPVLRQIADQAREPGTGQRYRQEIWKELFRSQILGSKFEFIQGKTVEIRNSTEDLGVAAYSDYIEAVLAAASTDWGVSFEFNVLERENVRCKPNQKCVTGSRDRAKK